MKNSRRKFTTLLVASFGLLALLSVDATAAQRGKQPDETVLMHGRTITPEASVKCERYIDRTFGRGTGAENHRTAAFAACIERPDEY
jgi:hypothetical protein